MESVLIPPQEKSGPIMKTQALQRKPKASKELLAVLDLVVTFITSLECGWIWMNEEESLKNLY